MAEFIQIMGLLKNFTTFVYNAAGTPLQRTVFFLRSAVLTAEMRLLTTCLRKGVLVVVRMIFQLLIFNI